MIDHIVILLGRTLVKVEVDKGNDRIYFEDTEGKKFMLYHSQNCCEHVYIESVVGDIQDLIGSPILLSEESTNYDNPKENEESHTWTFYKLATLKGYVDIRFYGSSNGYYSESVDFSEV